MSKVTGVRLKKTKSQKKQNSRAETVLQFEPKLCPTLSPTCYEVSKGRSWQDDKRTRGQYHYHKIQAVVIWIIICPFLSCWGTFSALRWTSSCSLLALLNLRLLELRRILQIHRRLQPHQRTGPCLLRPPTPRRHPGIWDQSGTWTLKRELEGARRRGGRAGRCWDMQSKLKEIF